MRSSFFSLTDGRSCPVKLLSRFLQMPQLTIISDLCSGEKHALRTIWSFGRSQWRGWLAAGRRRRGSEHAGLSLSLGSLRFSSFLWFFKNLWLSVLCFCVCFCSPSFCLSFLVYLYLSIYLRCASHFTYEITVFIKEKTYTLDALNFTQWCQRVTIT